MTVSRVLVLLLLLARSAAAQFGYFGQNKIQYRGFDWHVLRGEHVALYYYPEEQELARVALTYAEESYGVLERRFTHHPHRRTPLIIYASHSDFEQTNVLPFVPPEGLLGVTEFLKQRVALPFTGSYHDFRHTIRHELVHVFQLSLSAQTLQRYPRIRHASFPLWWTEGLAEFWSVGEDTRDQMFLRDMTVSGQLPSLGDLMDAYGAIVYPLGSSIHRFLAQTYGDWRIGAMYQDLWKYPTFEAEVLAVYGRPLVQLSDEWQFWMRHRFYPAVATGEPLAIKARLLTKLAIKPAAYRTPGDSVAAILYFSPSSGYTDIYSRPLTGGRSRVVVKGERTDQFESFHFFESRLDVSPAGVVVFSSKYLDRDALFFWSLAQRRVVGRYAFPQLVSILSPAWAPDGGSVVFSGLALSGYSDLYRLWLADGRLERLTSDRYQDVDPTFSPDGKSIVYCSDRTAFGAGGARNLFLLDLASGTSTYLTYGNWHDDQPRWSPSTGRIYFSSDRDGLLQLYSIDSTGRGRRETNTLNGAFDPQWVEGEHEIVFGGFADLSFNIYAAPAASPTDSELSPVALAPDRAPASWTWTELANPQYARADASPYGQKYTLDFAAGDAFVAPGLCSAQGAVFLFSDMLGDHEVFFTLSSFQGQGLGNLLDNVNGSVFYLNQAHRINWGVGAFRLRGFFFEGDLSTVFQETSAGVLAQLRYPLSRFRRIEAVYSVEHSDRFDTWVVAGDWRRYFRTSLRSAVALRGLGYYAGGDRSRPINIGGPWALRGYSIYGYVAGTRAWLVNTEWRFPITEFLSIGFPFGVARVPGVQGALFADLGRAWSATSEKRGTLGSGGLGLRMPVGPPLVLRLDLGYRCHSGALTGYALPSQGSGSKFVDFFFGFNY